MTAKIEIANGKIKKSKTKEDQEFRKKLKFYLKRWYNLELNDIIFILKEIGVTVDSYDIVYDDETKSYSFRFKIIDYYNTIYISLKSDSEMTVFRSKSSTYDTYYLSRSVNVRRK